MPKSESNTIPLESIIANTPQFIFWKNTDSVYLGCNENFAYIAGLKSAKDIVGKTDFDLPWAEFSADIYLEEDRIIIESGQSLSQKEVPLITSQDEKITVLVSKSPLFNDQNKVIGILGIYMDITDRKEMEAQLRISKERAEAANRAKTEFITNMSHDVRTPIAGVIGASYLLEHEGESTKDREFGHLIHVSADRLMQLLDDILDMVAAEDISDSNLEFSSFSVQSRLDFIKELLTPNALQNKIALNFDVADDIPPCLISDRVKIDRILVNLISNAFKFTHTGSITIAVSFVKLNENERSLLFSITDTGIGISEEQIDKIFDRFYRINPSYQSKYKGHGIGLFIVQKYVSALRGNISVKSTLGKGTTVEVVIPVKVGEAITDNKEEVLPFSNAATLTDKNLVLPLPLAPPKLISYKSDSSSPTVLVVEDDAVARRVVTAMLHRANFHVADAEDAERAVWEIMNNNYDLIVTDIGLPGMNGNQFTQVVRTWEKATDRIRLPIIGLTAHGCSQQSLAQAAGMDMLLAKPLNDEKVKIILDRFFAFTIESGIEDDTNADGQNEGLGFQLPKTESELFELSHFPLLDEKEGINASGSREMLQELLTLFVNETFPEELPLLREAYSKKDWSTVQSIAHKMKGGALYVGTIRLRYACQYTERYKLAGHCELLELLYQQLLVVIEETSAVLNNWLKLV